MDDDLDQNTAIRMWAFDAAAALPSNEGDLFMDILVDAILLERWVQTGDLTDQDDMDQGNE